MPTVLAQSGEDVTNAFSWAAALQYGVLLVTLLVGLGALGRALNKRINNAAQQAVKAAKETKQQLMTTNGHTAGDIIEQLPKSIEELKSIACANRDLAQQAVKLGVQNHEDLREHKRVDHRARTEEGSDVDS